MTLHSWIVFLPLPLMLVALSLDGLSYAEAKPAWRGWGRWVAGAAVAFVGLAAFTGMGARPTVTSSVAGAAVQWDRHVAWAVGLGAIVVGLGVVRLRAVGPRWTRSPTRILLLDLALLLLIAGITLTGIRLP